MSLCSIVDFLYGFLPLKTWRNFLIRRHLERCPRCQEKLASREEARSLLTQEASANPLHPFWPEIRAGLAGESNKERDKQRVEKPWPRLRWRWAAFAAGFLVVGFMFFWLIRDFRPNTAAPAEDRSERFRINYLKVENEPAQAYLYQPLESNMIIIWVGKSS